MPFQHTKTKWAWHMECGIHDYTFGCMLVEDYHFRWFSCGVKFNTIQFYTIFGKKSMGAESEKCCFLNKRAFSAFVEKTAFLALCFCFHFNDGFFGGLSVASEEATHGVGLDGPHAQEEEDDGYYQADDDVGSPERKVQVANCDGRQRACTAQAVA